MSDDRDGTDPDCRPLADGGREKPNIGEYVHEPAVGANDDGPERPRSTETGPVDADRTEADRVAAGAVGRNGSDGPVATEPGRTGVAETGPGETRPRATGSPGPADGTRVDAAPGERLRGTGTVGQSAEPSGAVRSAGSADAPAAGPPQDPFGAPDEVDVWTRVGAAVSRGGVRATAAGIAGAYGLLGGGFALLSILVGGLGLPVLETTWDSYPLVAEGALLTAVPTASLLLALFAGGYATLRHGGVDAVVAGGVGAGAGTALATALTVGAVGAITANATIIVGGVLVDLLLLAAVASLLAAGTTLVATRFGLSGDALAGSESAAGTDAD